MGALQDQIADATKAAMKARDKARVAALRLMGAEIKRVEVDERRELSDDDVIAILNRMLKQRKDSLSQFQDAGRDDLAQLGDVLQEVRRLLGDPLGEVQRVLELQVAERDGTDVTEQSRDPESTDARVR